MLPAVLARVSVSVVSAQFEGAGSIAGRALRNCPGIVRTVRTPEEATCKFFVLASLM